MSLHLSTSQPKLPSQPCHRTDLPELWGPALHGLAALAMRLSQQVHAGADGAPPRADQHFQGDAGKGRPRAVSVYDTGVVITASVLACSAVPLSSEGRRQCWQSFYGWVMLTILVVNRLSYNSADRKVLITQIVPVQSWLVSLYMDCPPNLGITCPSTEEVDVSILF